MDKSASISPDQKRGIGADSGLGKHRPSKGENQSNKYDQAGAASAGSSNIENLKSNLKSKSKLKKNMKGSDDDDFASGGDDNGTGDQKTKKKFTSRKAKDKEGASGATGQQFQHHDIAKNFSSFDILWFDITTKVRELYFDLNQPMIDKIYAQKTMIEKLEKTNDEQQAKINELDAVVYNKGQNLDIFQNIFKKILSVEADRKVVESRLEANVESVMKTFEEYGFKFEQNEKVFKQLTQNTEMVVEQLSQIKDEMAKNNKMFIQNLTQVNEELIYQQKILRDESTRLLGIQNSQDLELKRQDSLLKETLSRIGNGEDRIFALEQETRRLDRVKANDEQVKAEVQRINEHLEKDDVWLADLDKHATALDNYLDKYQPLRMQSMISDHLNACLHSETRRKHKLFDDMKTGYLLRIVLEDDGNSCKIQELISQMTSMAQQTVENQEREKRKKATMLEASSSYDTDTLNNENDQNIEGVQNLINLKENNETGQLPDIQMDDEDDDLKLNELKLQSNQKSKKKSKNKNSITQQQSAVLEDPSIYSLNELVKSDFEMPVSDKDFRLSHEQLIKAVKILLYKINLTTQKSNIKYNDSIKDTELKLQMFDNSVKSTIDEVKHFLHTVHSDFEQFQIRHKKDHNDINLKSQKLQDAHNQMVENSEVIKDAVLKYATLLGCLLEFNGIQQALSLNDVVLQSQVFQILSQNANKEGSPGTDAGKVRFSIKSRQTSVTSIPASNNIKNKQSFFPTFQTIDQVAQNSKEDSFDANSPTSMQNSLSKQASRRKLENSPSGNVSVQKKESKNQGKAKYSQGSFQGFGEIDYRMKKLQRTQLLEMRQTLIDKCEQVISHMNWPFQQNNLGTKKIFNDLYQYHMSNKLIQGVKSVGIVTIDQFHNVNQNENKQTFMDNLQQQNINLPKIIRNNTNINTLNNKKFSLRSSDQKAQGVVLPDILGGQRQSQYDSNSFVIEVRNNVNSTSNANIGADFGVIPNQQYQQHYSAVKQQQYKGVNSLISPQNANKIILGRQHDQQNQYYPNNFQSPQQNGNQQNHNKILSQGIQMNKQGAHSQVLQNNTRAAQSSSGEHRMGIGYQNPVQNKKSQQNEAKIGINSHQYVNQSIKSIQFLKDNNLYVQSNNNIQNNQSGINSQPALAIQGGDSSVNETHIPPSESRNFHALDSLQPFDNQESHSNNDKSVGGNQEANSKI